MALAASAKAEERKVYNLAAQSHVKAQPALGFHTVALRSGPARWSNFLIACPVQRLRCKRTLVSTRQLVFVPFVAVELILARREDMSANGMAFPQGLVSTTASM